MKTAMQQLHEHLVNSWSAPGDLWKPDKIIEKVESMMELEKKNTMENKMIHPCNCREYNGKQCYNCLNGAHSLCSACGMVNSATLGLPIEVLNGAAESSGSVAAPKDIEATPRSFKDILRIHSINTEYVAAAEKWYATSAPLSYFEAAFKMYADSELASLRQQLEEHKAINSLLAGDEPEVALANEVLQLREALKELLPIAQWGYDLLVPFDKARMVQEWPAIIERARKLISK